MEKLTHQEEEIMLIIWQVKSGVIKDFLNRMEEPKPPYTTVASIVKNLEISTSIFLSWMKVNIKQSLCPG